MDWGFVVAMLDGVVCIVYGIGALPFVLYRQKCAIGAEIVAFLGLVKCSLFACLRKNF